MVGLFSMCLCIMKFDSGFMTSVIDGVSRIVPSSAHLAGPTSGFIVSRALGLKSVLSILRVFCFSFGRL